LRLFEGSLESLLGIGARAGLSPPKTMAVDEAKKEAESVVGVRGFSWAAERWLLAVTVRTRELSGSFLEATVHSESLVPWVAGATAVASGLLLGTGLSEG
jgi:hypothetical protein